MGSPGDEHSAPPEPPQSDLPPSSGSSVALLALAWLSCVIGIGYSLVYMLGRAMSVSSRGPSVYETFATSVWFMISAVAILTYVKRQRPGTAATILLALPGAVTALGLLFALPGQMDNPLAVLLILIIPAVAAVYDFASHTERSSGWALEGVLVASLILTPAWIATHGFDFGEARSQDQRAAIEYKKQQARETLFTSLTPSLKAALPKEVGTWRLIESTSRKDDPSVLSKSTQEEIRTSIIPIRWDIYARYEDSAAKPYDPAQAQERFKQHTAEVKARLDEVAQELEATKGNDTPIGMSDERFHRRLVLESEQTALHNQERWTADNWRKWDEKENVIAVRIQLWAPGEMVWDGYGSPVTLPSAPPGVILPWDDPLHSYQIDSGRQETCTIGQCNQSAQAEIPIQYRVEGRIPFVFTSVGMSVSTEGNDAVRMGRFVKDFDLSRLVDITRNTPVTSLQSH